MATWDEMEPRERDAWIATHVMGNAPLTTLDVNPDCRHERGRLRDSGGNAWWFEVHWPPRYSTDAAADYLVLKKVRETWGFMERETFQTILQRIEWSPERQREKKIPQFSLMYEPGDYSHAAYLALKETP